MRVDALQQNQAMQMAGVHDRLDAVELELPLIQEQGALRMRDMEVRIGVEIEQAARSAVEEATAVATSVIQEEVSGRFSALAAQMEAQRADLRQMRESKMEADTRLGRAILDIERLCGNLTQGPEERPYRIPAEPAASPFRSRISEHIRKAAIDLAPGEGNPLNGDAHLEKQELNPVTPAAAVLTAEPIASARPAATEPIPSTPLAKPEPPITSVPGFDAWKRQFMQDGEPLMPTLAGELGQSPANVACPRCFSDRTRPATLNRLDRILRLANVIPHRCRSCSHRFYKRGAPSKAGQRRTHTDAMET